jgi:hypothetical protein
VSPELQRLREQLEALPTAMQYALDYGGDYSPLVEPHPRIVLRRALDEAKQNGCIVRATAALEALQEEVQWLRSRDPAWPRP